MQMETDIAIICTLIEQSFQLNCVCRVYNCRLCCRDHVISHVFDHIEDMPVLEGPENRACYRHACAIQKCLAESHYDQASCKWAVDALKACCRRPESKGSLHCGKDWQRQEEDGEEEGKPAQSGDISESGISTTIVLEDRKAEEEPKK